MLRRWTARAAALALVAAALVAGGSATTAGAKSKVPGLQFLGQAIVPTGQVEFGTTVGGLSSIAYDAKRGVYYSISDDSGLFAGAPTRFYTLRIDVSDGHLDAGDVDFTAVTTLKGADGLPFPATSVDPEGLGLTKAGTLVVTSEGYANSLVDPWVREFSLAGNQLRTLPVPAPFLPNAAHTRGVRPNLGFESAGVPPNGRFVFTANEGALVQDGPAAALGTRSPARILRYNLQNGRLDRQYLYWTEPVAEPPVPPTNFSVNGIADVLVLNNEFLLTMERSFSVGAPDTGNTIKLFQVKLAGATNVNGADSLEGRLDSIRPAQKTLLLDLDTLGIPLDNVEGMTLGPRLPDGRQSLVLVSDNNFAAAQFTQFLLFAIAKH